MRPRRCDPRKHNCVRYLWIFLRGRGLARVLHSGTNMPSLGQISVVFRQPGLLHVTGEDAMISIRPFALGSLAIAALCALVPADSAEAALRARRAAAVAAAGGPACCEPVCCPPNICYRDRTRCNSCCDSCQPDIKQVLTVCDPCTGCPVAVPVCLPACTTGCPEVCARGALLGRGVVTYTWCNGFSATIRFDRCGDVLVTYRS